MKHDLQTFIQYNEKKLTEYTVFIVCNLKKENSVEISNYENFNIATEYLSDSEFHEVLSLFKQCNLHEIKIFDNEISFIKFILKNINKIDKSRTIVYNSAQSGTGVGRKSLIPSFCNLEQLLCTGSNAYVVSLCRHKYHINKLLYNAGFSVPSTYIYYHDWLFNEEPDYNKKYLLKPIYESASIGIDKNSLIDYNTNSIQLLKNKVSELSQPIIAQEFIPGYEIEFPIYIHNNRFYPLIPVGLHIDKNNFNMQYNFLDYKTIYSDSYHFYNFNNIGKLPKNMDNVLKSIAELLGLNGLCRIDFRISNNGNYYITDVSTNPHFISHSSVNFAFQTLNIPENFIIKSILLSAIK